MASIADTLETSPFVVSPINLGAFMKWTGEADEDEIDEVMQVVTMVEHRMGPTIFGNIDFPQVVIHRPDFDRKWVMPREECQEENCRRCETGRGGWQFRWIGPWTCPITVGDENTTAQEVMQRAIACRCGRH